MNRIQDYKWHIIVTVTSLTIGYIGGVAGKVIDTPTEVNKLNDRLLQVEQFKKDQQLHNEEVDRRMNLMNESLIEYKADQKYMIKKIDGLDSKFDKFVEGYFNRVPKQF
jgi:hypothetical protein